MVEEAEKLKKEMEVGGYLKAKNAAKYIGVGRTTFLKLSKKEDFPKPIKLSETLVLYKRTELDEWMDKKRRQK